MSFRFSETNSAHNDPSFDWRPFEEASATDDTYAGLGLTFYSARPALEHKRSQGKLASRGHQFIEPSALEAYKSYLV